MDEVSWTFYGYVTPAGGRSAQDWFDELPNDAKDEIRDTVSFLSKLPVHLWVKPQFFPLGDGLFEVRRKVGTLSKTLRFYGCYWPKGDRYVFTFLLGGEKQKMNERDQVKVARDRKADIESGSASIDTFDFFKD